ncbi:MAG TPA: biopolymer transporter ExbD [Pirellulaceae bacterium]|nr:biopolymer transporter ExbD [Pirellulaceae bacterium]
MTAAPDEQVSQLHHVEEIADDPIPRFHRARELGDDEMDITPMIDITFLLLIFFLVASHMDSQASVDLPKARFGSTVGIKESVIITLDKNSDGPARIFKGDNTDPANEFVAANLLAEEDQLVAYIEDQLATSVPPKQHVLIKAARGVKHRDVARVVKAAGLVEKVQQLHLAVLEVQ